MANRVVLKLDGSAVFRVVGGQSAAAVGRAATITARRAQQNIHSLGRVRTGAMAGRMVALPERVQGLHPTYRVGSDVPYIKFQERGTKGSVARPGGVLRFKPKGSNTYVFAKRTGPIKPGRFMENALRVLRASDFL